jgi:hypothetical protein
MRLEFSGRPSSGTAMTASADTLSALRLFDTSYRTWPNSVLPFNCNNCKPDLQIHDCVTQNRENEPEVSACITECKEIECERSTSAGNRYVDYKI